MTSRKLHEAWGNFLGKCVLNCIYSPFPKITYILTFPPNSLEQFLRGAISWAAVLILPPNKIYLLTLTLYIFFKSTLVSSVQLNSVAQSCPTLCDPMDCSMPGLPVHHQLPGFAQTHVHWVSDAIQPSHPLSSPSPSALNLSQHQGLFQ